jgi:hypothetical protein
MIGGIPEFITLKKILSIHMPPEKGKESVKVKYSNLF